MAKKKNILSARNDFFESLAKNNFQGWHGGDKQLFCRRKKTRVRFSMLSLATFKRGSRVQA